MADPTPIPDYRRADPEALRRRLDEIVGLGLTVVDLVYRQSQYRQGQAGGGLHRFMTLANACQRAIRAVRHAKIIRYHAAGVALLPPRDPEDDILYRPIADVVAGMCRDLGLAMAALPSGWRPDTPARLIELCEQAAGTAPTARSSLRRQRALLHSLPADAPKH